MSNTGYIYLYIEPAEIEDGGVYRHWRRGMRSTHPVKGSRMTHLASRGATAVTLRHAPHRPARAPHPPRIHRLYFSPAGNPRTPKYRRRECRRISRRIIYLEMRIAQIPDFIPRPLEKLRASCARDRAIAVLVLTSAIHHHPGSHENIVVDIRNYSDNHSLVNHRPAIYRFAAIPRQPAIADALNFSSKSTGSR